MGLGSAFLSAFPTSLVNIDPTSTLPSDHLSDSHPPLLSYPLTGTGLQPENSPREGRREQTQEGTGGPTQAADTLRYAAQQG